MAMTRKPNLGLIHFSAIFFIFSFFCIAILSSEAVSNSDTPTVYELLSRHGLPKGLFPDSVVNYTLSPTGRLVVKLRKACYMRVTESMYYQDTITGVLGKGFLTYIKGIQVWAFPFLWYNVDEISVDLSPLDVIYFKSDDSNVAYDANLFKTVQSCKNSARGSCFRSFKGALQLPVDKAADFSNGTRSDASC